MTSDDPGAELQPSRLLDSAGLAQLGWAAEQNPPPVVMGDAALTPRWRVSRIWSSTGVFTALPHRGSAQAVRVLIGAQGRGYIETAAGDTYLPSRHLIIVRGNSPLTTRNRRPWARYVWDIELPYSRLSILDDVVNSPLPLSRLSWSLISGTSNSFMRNDLGSERQIEHLGDALAAVVAAAVESSVGDDGVPAAGAHGVYERGMLLIERHHRDPGFDPTRLALMLAVSLPTLYRAFRGRHTTPAQEIERRRVLSAIPLLEVPRARGRQPLAVIAKKSGFTTARRMAQAVPRQTGRSL